MSTEPVDPAGDRDAAKRTLPRSGIGTAVGSNVQRVRRLRATTDDAVGVFLEIGNARPIHTSVYAEPLAFAKWGQPP